MSLFRVLNRLPMSPRNKAVHVTRRDPFFFFFFLSLRNLIRCRRPDKCIISLIPPLLTKSSGRLRFLSRPRPPWSASGARATRPAGVIKPGSLRTLAGHVTLICQGIRGHKPIYLSTPICAGSIYSCRGIWGERGGRYL